MILTLTWDTLGPNPCHVCNGLRGWTWMFEAGVDPFPEQLEHPSYGPVLDMRIHKRLTHGGWDWNCHCEVVPKWDMSKLDRLIAGLRDAVVNV